MLSDRIHTDLTNVHGALTLGKGTFPGALAFDKVMLHTPFHPNHIESFT